MKKMIMTAAAVAFVLGGLVVAPATADAKKPFCASCHKADKDKMCPAIKNIVKAYGSVDAVFAFLDSDKGLKDASAKFSASSEKYAKKRGTMKGNLKKYRGKSAEDKAAIKAWFAKMAE